MSDILKLLEDGLTALGHHDHSMRRDRPYSGQPWTDSGVRGATEIKGVTFRDLRDCFIRAVCLSAHHVVPHLYDEADKGEDACLSAADLYGWDLDRLDPMAVAQNLSCEIERVMGIFPNVAGGPSADEIMACFETGDMTCASLSEQSAAGHPAAVDGGKQAPQRSETERSTNDPAALNRSGEP